MRLDTLTSSASTESANLPSGSVVSAMRTESGKGRTRGINSSKSCGVTPIVNDRSLDPGADLTCHSGGDCCPSPRSTYISKTSCSSSHGLKRISGDPSDAMVTPKSGLPSPEHMLAIWIRPINRQTYQIRPTNNRIRPFPSQRASPTD